MKRPLAEGETWQVTRREEALLGYGAPTFYAVRLNRNEAALMSFYLTGEAELSRNDRFVVFSSYVDQGTVKTYALKSSGAFGRLYLDILSNTDWDLAEAGLL